MPSRKPYVQALLSLCLLIPAQVIMFGDGPNRVLRIQDRFIAPCCWSQSVAMHDSPVAREMRDEIVKLVSEGKTEEQIVDHYVARYGERILRQPRGKAWVWLNAVPIGVLTLGVAGVLVFLARARRLQAV
jgi:cytochrome c-type biogenesis protein CcmH